ncbi:DUF2897 domain-containing protein [Vibrio sp. 10N.286.49.B3]|uniref:DUF2897 family protein n=1 Tax=Vibrio sp. 10N.286.49.B3 TaxID=1880855 RepID=UPI000C839C4A|nr:DUF2897 family protein [Vibrio sp. 10N.286.49.B3]PMH41060.1 DUF2897 domain-containing protein [Vibrio sp. 10N.286.49.B3]
MAFLTNPWVICFIVVSVIVGNIAALKYTANMNFGQGKTPHKRKDDLAKLTALDKQNKIQKK